MLFPFIAGLIQVFGSAFVVEFIGLAKYGGYLGMFDWATVWPVIAVSVKYLGFVGVGICVVALLAIPQIQYAMNKENYFLITDDYEAYAAKKNAKK